MAAIEIQSLSYCYPDGTPALRDISLSIAEGEMVGLVGANGAGKSTLLLHLNGVLGATSPLGADGRGGARGALARAAASDSRGKVAAKRSGAAPPAVAPYVGAPERGRRPHPRSSGAVMVDGLPVTRARLKEIRRRVGLVFQNPDDQLFMPRVFDDVAFGAVNLGYPQETVERKVRDALMAVGMPEFASRTPQHLSLGEKKKIAIATVLVMDCRALALDEPTAGLDPRGRRDLMRLLAGLDCTQVIATHDLEMVLEICDRAILLSRGRVVAIGRPSALLADEALLEAHGLEVPYSLRRPSIVLV